MLFKCYPDQLVTQFEGVDQLPEHLEHRNHHHLFPFHEELLRPLSNFAQVIIKGIIITDKELYIDDKKLPSISTVELNFNIKILG